MCMCVFYIKSIIFHNIIRYIWLFFGLRATNIYNISDNIDGVLLRSHRDHGRSYFLVEKMSVTPIE